MIKLKNRSPLGIGSLLFILAFAFTACANPANGGRTQIEKPELVQNHFTHNGSLHTVELTVENDAYTLGGDVTGTDFGEYTATVTLNDIDRYEWPDGTTEPLNLTWTIGKQQIAKPELVQNHFTHTGSPHTVDRKSVV